MAANTDKLRKKKNRFSTTLNGSISSSDTSATFASLSGVPTDTAVTVTIDRVDANGASTPSKVEDVTGVVSGNTMSNLLRGEGSTTAQSHDNAAVVEITWETDTWNDAVDWALVEHNQDGTHDFSGGLTVDTISEATSGNGVAIDGVYLKDGNIVDSNGNRILDLAQVASAVNFAKLTNAATSGTPVISVGGSDGNVDLSLQAKGTGTVKKPTAICIQVAEGATALTTGDGKAYFIIPEEVDGMVIHDAHAQVVTAGVTGRTDVQLHNVTDSVDVFSTVLSIESAETSSETSAAPVVINTSNDDVSTNDLFRIDIDSVSTGTAPQGLIIVLRFKEE